VHLADAIIVNGFFSEMYGSLISGIPASRVSGNTDSVFIDIRIDVLVVIYIVDEIKGAVALDGRDRIPLHSGTTRRITLSVRVDIDDNETSSRKLKGDVPLRFP